MERGRLEQMTKGWWIGDFLPSFHRTSLVEVGYKIHPAGEIYPPHYQQTAHEWNLLIHGTLIANDQTLQAGDLFHFLPQEVCRVRFVTDCEVVVVKMPSLPQDTLRCLLS